MSTTRSTNLREACIKRDGRCLRCLRGHDLQAHHVVAVDDGGADELANLDSLCSACHREWHMIAEGHVAYTVWRSSVPPVIRMKIAG